MTPQQIGSLAWEHSIIADIEKATTACEIARERLQKARRAMLAYRFAAVLAFFAGLFLGLALGGK